MTIFLFLLGMCGFELIIDLGKAGDVILLCFLLAFVEHIDVAFQGLLFSKSTVSPIHYLYTG